jgi:hypothetical protein
MGEMDAQSTYFEGIVANAFCKSQKLSGLGDSTDKTQINGRGVLPHILL